MGVLLSMVFWHYIDERLLGKRFWVYGLLRSSRCHRALVVVNRSTQTLFAFHVLRYTCAQLCRQMA